MQTLAGVTTGGLSSEGFYIGFLLILILVVGIYVAYTCLLYTSGLIFVNVEVLLLIHCSWVMAGCELVHVKTPE